MSICEIIMLCFATSSSTFFAVALYLPYLPRFSSSFFPKTRDTVPSHTPALTAAMLHPTTSTERSYIVAQVSSLRSKNFTNLEPPNGIQLSALPPQSHSMPTMLFLLDLAHIRDHVDADIFRTVELMLLF